MSSEEIIGLGNEFGMIMEKMKRQAFGIVRELKNKSISKEKEEELKESLKMIYIQFGEKWKEFVNDAKNGCDTWIEIKKS